MWDYGFLVACFAILVIFLVYYLVNPHINIRLNKTYVELLVFETLFIPFEMLVNLANENYASLSVPFLHMLNMLFLILYIGRLMWFFRFTVNFLKIKPRTSPAKTFFAFSVFGISVSAILLNPLGNGVFSFDETGYHPEALFNIMIHFCLIFYVALSIMLLIIHWDKRRRRKFIGAVAYNLSLLVGIIITMFSERNGVFNIFCLISLIIIYLSFENPDFYMSDRTSTFNSTALRDILEDIVGKNYFLLMGIVLHNYSEERTIYGSARMDATLGEIGRYLTRRFPRQKVFYLRNGQFAILGGDLMSWDRLYEEISARFRYPWGVDDGEMYLNISFVKIDSSVNLRTSEEIVDHMVIEFDRLSDSVEGNGVVELDAATVGSIDRQIQVKQYLDYAVDHDRVEVFLQPITDAKTGTLVGAEALARIRDFEGKIISPGEFIPIAEKNGRIDRLGEQVFEKVCRLANDERIKALGLSWINVNLSPVQFMKRDLAKRLTATINRHEVPVDLIHLEITEQSIAEYSVMQREISSLCDYGFKFVLDDYGTGYSNLSRFKRYPFVNIKLDMDVVFAHFREKDVLLPTLVHAFKEMKYSVTAEGVETEEMARELCEMGVDFLQGFYFSVPLPPDELIEKYGAKKE